MDWARVAQHLYEEGKALRERAHSSFPSDQQTQREMQTRAAVLIAFAEALRAGLENSE